MEKKIKNLVDERDIDHSFGVAAIQALANSIEDLKSSLPQLFRHKVKQKSGALLEELNRYLTFVDEVESNEQFKSSSKLSTIIEQRLITVTVEYKKVFIKK